MDSTFERANTRKDEWLTPPEIIRSLGEFDLDPCSPINRPWDTAKNHFTINDNGLLRNWDGRIWCNPPYGKDTKFWLHKCAQHGNAIALVFARTETSMFFNYVWPLADAIFFFRGRIQFHYIDGTSIGVNAGAPSALVAYGKDNVIAIEKSGLKGCLVKLKA